MALSAAVAAVAGQSELFEVFQQDVPAIPKRGREFPLLVARNGSDTQNTVNLFMDAASSDMEFVASIVDACVERTVYAMRCTKGPADVGSAYCNPTAPVLTVTEGPSTYTASSSTSGRVSGYDVKATVQEGCDLQGTTAANCSFTIGGSAAKTSTTTVAYVMVTGTDYRRFDVAITGGAEKTASPTACAKSAAAGLSAKAVAVWGLLGAVGVVGFLGC